MVVDSYTMRVTNPRSDHQLDRSAKPQCGLCCGWTQNVQLFPDWLPLVSLQTCPAAPQDPCLCCSSPWLSEPLQQQQAQHTTESNVCGLLTLWYVPHRHCCHHPPTHASLPPTLTRTPTLTHAEGHPQQPAAAAADRVAACTSSATASARVPQQRTIRQQPQHHTQRPSSC